MPCYMTTTLAQPTEEDLYYATAWLDAKKPQRPHALKELQDMQKLREIFEDTDDEAEEEPAAEEAEAKGKDETAPAAGAEEGDDLDDMTTADLRTMLAEEHGAKATKNPRPRATCLRMIRAKRKRAARAATKKPRKPKAAATKKGPTQAEQREAYRARLRALGWTVELKKREKGGKQDYYYTSPQNKPYYSLNAVLMAVDIQHEEFLARVRTHEGAGMNEKDAIFAAYKETYPQEE